MNATYQAWSDLKDKQTGARKAVFVRVGDFFETYGEQAELCAKILGLPLTRRVIEPGLRIVMLGFPYHVCSAYFDDLRAAGYTVVALIDEVVTTIKPRKQRRMVAYDTATSARKPFEWASDIMTAEDRDTCRALLYGRGNDK